jgi:type IV fimbrial biogenesis protein FimT
VGAHGIRKDGFTFLELLVVVLIMGVLAAIAIPAFSRWYPSYRLRSAATDLYSHMHMAKMGAVKDNFSWAILFDPGTNTYTICAGDTDTDWLNGCTEERSINLNDYKYGVGYGHGNATSAIGGGFGDEITYSSPDNVAVFNPRGTSNAGYVYLQNNKNSSYGVGTLSSGVVRLRKWNGSTWE